MTEWWSYGLSDFLMFSPQAYWRLVARHNAAWWPAQAFALAAALALPWLLRRPATGGGRAALLLLALAWAWVGWAFAWQRYGEIFLGAAWLAAACGMQAMLLAAGAAWPVRPAVPAGPAAVAAGLPAALALLYPLLAPLTGRAWSEAEVSGFMPDPTAWVTLAVLAALPAWPRALRLVLAAIPLLALLLGAATRWLLAQ